MQSLEQDNHGHQNLPEPLDDNLTALPNNSQENSFSTVLQDVTLSPTPHTDSRQTDKQAHTGLQNLEPRTHTRDADGDSSSPEEAAHNEQEVSSVTHQQSDTVAAPEQNQLRAGKGNRRPRVWGRSDVRWQEELTENGQKLYRLLMLQQGDRDLLPSIAQEEQFNLDAAVTELKNYGLLDEADPLLLKLISREL